jgi:hypothetical protein
MPLRRTFMNRTIASRLALSAAVAGLLAACSGEAPADAPAGAAEVPAAIKERQDNFEGIGDAFKAVRGELEKDTPDFTLIAAKATISTSAPQGSKGISPPARAPLMASRPKRSPRSGKSPRSSRPQPKSWSMRVPSW